MKFRLIGALIYFLSTINPALPNELYFFGDVRNLETSNASSVSMTIVEEGHGRYRAIGIFDNITLFGRFNVAGQRVPCKGQNLCINFAGQLELGDDESGFPELTRSGFSFKLAFSQKKAEGSYLISAISPYMMKDQPGLLKLRKSGVELLNNQASERVRQHPDQAKYYWDRAIAYELQEKFALAEQDYQTYTRLYAEDARGFAKVGRMLLMQQKYDEAKPWINAAITRDPGKSLGWTLLGHLALLQGNSELATESYSKSLRLISSHRSFDESLVHDLNLFIRHGWKTQAANDALAMVNDSFTRVAGFYLGDADVADYLGRYAEAIPLYGKALSIAGQDHGAEHLMVGRILFKLANNQTQAGLYREALENYGRSLKIIRAHKESSDYDIVNIQMAEAAIYEKLGQNEMVEKLYRAAVHDCVSSRTILPMDTASNTVTLAMFLYRNGRTEEALDLYKKTLPILLRLMGPTHPGMSRYYNDVALLHSSAGLHDEAIGYFGRALTIDEHYYGEDHLNVAVLLGNIGNEYLAKQDYDAANSYFVRALNVATVWQNPEILVYANYCMQQLMKTRGRIAEAILFGKQTVNELQRLRHKNYNLNKELRQSFAKKNEAYYKELAELLIEQGRLPEAQQVLAMLKEDEYFEFIRRDASSDARDTTVNFNAEEQRWTQRYAEISGQVAALGAELRELQKKEGHTDSDKDRIKLLRADLAVAMKTFNHTVQALQDAFLKLKSERFAELSKKQVDIDQRGLLRELGHDAVLMQYIVMEDALHIILTTMDVIVARKVAIGSAALNRRVQQFREVLGSPNKDPREAGRALYELLIAPVKADLEQVGAKMLMVSLDGALRYIPFAALYDGQGYLAEKYAVAIYTEAARDRIKDLPQGEWQVAALGLSHKVEGFNALPAVVGELRGIVRAKGGITGVVPGVIYLDGDFTNDRLEEILFDQYRVLHIASHFVFTAGTLEKSYLLLGDGSRLTLAQIQQGNYDLGSVELLTLSACETAVGETGADGKEVEGLGALAQKKGAKGILASLWPVADESTGVFMRDLYQIKMANVSMTKAQAMQQAQLSLLRGDVAASSSSPDQRGLMRAAGQVSGKTFRANPKTPFAHPYYWAPFILMGNWL